MKITKETLSKNIVNWVILGLIFLLSLLPVFIISGNGKNIVSLGFIGVVLTFIPVILFVLSLLNVKKQIKSFCSAIFATVTFTFVLTYIIILSNVAKGFFGSGESIFKLSFWGYFYLISLLGLFIWNFLEMFTNITNGANEKFLDFTQKTGKQIGKKAQEFGETVKENVTESKNKENTTENLNEDIQYNHVENEENVYVEEILDNRTEVASEDIDKEING